MFRYDGHVRVERVALEHHRDVAVARRQVRDRAAADSDVAARDLLEAGDHPQRRRLAAAGRADQDQELLVADGQVDAGDRPDVAEPLLDLVEDDVGHDKTERPEPTAPAPVPVNRMRLDRTQLLFGLFHRGARVLALRDLREHRRDDELRVHARRRLRHRARDSR